MFDLLIDGGLNLLGVHAAAGQELLQGVKFRIGQKVREPGKFVALAAFRGTTNPERQIEAPVGKVLFVTKEQKVDAGGQFMPRAEGPVPVTRNWTWIVLAITFAVPFVAVPGAVCPIPVLSPDVKPMIVIDNDIPRGMLRRQPDLDGIFGFGG